MCGVMALPFIFVLNLVEQPDQLLVYNILAFLNADWPVSLPAHKILRLGSAPNRKGVWATRVSSVARWAEWGR